MPTSHELDFVSVATSHGARSRSQSPPVTMHRARRIWCGTAVARSVSVARAAAAGPPPLTSATSSTTARYSTVPWPRALRMGEPCGSARYGTTARLQRNCTNSAMAEPASVRELAEHDEVAAVDRHDLPVAPAQGPVGPPAILDEPRLADRHDFVTHEVVAVRES